jgi:PAS domain S-box-containing protein
MPNSFFFHQRLEVLMKKDRTAQERPVSSELEERYRQIVETANEGIWEIDQEAHTVFVNRRMADMLGYTVEEMMGCSVFEFLFPEDHQEAENRLDSAKLGSPSPSNEFRYRRKDGSVLWTIGSRTTKLDPQGNFLGSFAMFSDITKRKRNEERLREQAEILEWAHVVIRDMDGHIVLWNKGAEEFYGWTKEEAIGKVSHELFMTKFPLAREDYEKNLFTNGEWEGELEQVSRDGRPIIVASYQVIHRDSTGKPVAILEVNNDITERKKAEEALRELNLELEDRVQERTAVLQQMIKVLRKEIAERVHAEEALKESHQRLQQLSRRLVEVQEEERRALARELHDRVGQDLSALKLNLTLMENAMLQDSMQDSSTRLHDSMNLVDETTKLVRDLLNELRPAVLDDYGLKAALQAYIEDFTPRYNIPVVLNIANEPLPRLGPSLEITLLRIAQEALTNIARHAQADRATLSLRLENNAVYLTVQDNGVGMEASRKEDHRVSHGLKIMRERAEAFGGTIDVVPAEERGTKVEVAIPLSTLYLKSNI